MACSVINSRVESTGLSAWKSRLQKFQSAIRSIFTADSTIAYAWYPTSGFYCTFDPGLSVLTPAIRPVSTSRPGADRIVAKEQNDVMTTRRGLNDVTELLAVL
jgi:hypothetical protein